MRQLVVCFLRPRAYELNLRAEVGLSGSHRCLQTALVMVNRQQNGHHDRPATKHRATDRLLAASTRNGHVSRMFPSNCFKLIFSLGFDIQHVRFDSIFVSSFPTKWLNN